MKKMAVMNVMVGVSTNGKAKQSKNKKIPSIASQKQIRVSKRNLRMKRNAGIKDNNEIKSVSRTVEFAKSPIDYGNPKHKILFLTGLGLTPKSTTIMPPFVKLKRVELPKSPKFPSYVNYTVPIIPRYYHSSIIPSSKQKKVENVVEEHNDAEDLDLELLICPLDIPEFFEELFMKKTPSTMSNDSGDNKQKAESNNSCIVQKKNQRHTKFVKQPSVGTYLPKQRKCRQEIPFIDLTQDQNDDDISCQILIM